MTAKTDRARPATAAQAEELAKKALTDFVDACHVADRAHMGNCLMKLCSVAGMVMASAEGSAIAADRLQGTADFVRKKMPAQPASLEKLQ